MHQWPIELPIAERPLHGIEHRAMTTVSQLAPRAEAEAGGLPPDLATVRGRLTTTGLKDSSCTDRWRMPASKGSGCIG